MNPTKARALTPFLVAVALLLSAGMANARVHTERSSISAEGVGSIDLTGANGSIKLETNDEEVIRVHVDATAKRWTDENPFRFLKDWFLSSSYDDVEDLLEALRIETDSPSEGTLRIRLSPSAGAREDRVEEQWIVSVPERMAVTLRMNSAKMEVVGVAGGTRVRAGHGSIGIDVPSGDIDVELSVGNVEVKSASRSVGEVDLESTVGSTKLWLNGVRVKYPDPPGPGSRVQASGRGEDAVHVEVTVGDVSVDVGQP